MVAQHTINFPYNVLVIILSEKCGAPDNSVFILGLQNNKKC